MTFLLIAANLLFIIFLLTRFKRFFEGRVPKKIWITALLFKVACGIGLGFLYFIYYHFGDTWAFYNEAKALANFASEDATSYLEYLFLDESVFDTNFSRNPGAKFLTKVISVACLVTASNYWVMSVYFSLFSFYGLSKLVLTLCEIFPSRHLTAYIALFFWPSFIFWSSGLSKESVALGAMGLIISTLIDIAFRKSHFNVQQFVISIIMFVLLWKVKYYYAAMLILAMASFGITLFVCKKVQIRKRLIQISLFFGVGVVMTLLVSFIHPNFEFSRLREVIVLTHDLMVDRSKPESLVHYYQLSENTTSLIINAPLALFSGWFGPMLWDHVFRFLKFLAAIENTVLVGLFLLALRRLKFSSNDKIHLLFVSTISYCVLLSIFLALSTPNFGTLVRYRVGFHAFFVFIILMNNKYIMSRLTKLFDKFG